MKSTTKIIKTAITLLMAILATVIYAQTPEVGTLPGNFSVSPSGAATYSIPIDLPPGRAGMTPSLALTYNSQGGNGLLGMGWALSGLSSITRTGTTIYHDEEIDGVDFDDNDQFMLDGNRLIAVNAQETEFRTELETYSKIVAKSTAGSGPEWFEVHTKSGMIMEYGNTTKSRIEASGRSDILFWHLNQIRDRKGNYIDFIYEENEGMGIITKISYTGNNTPENMLDPFYEIIFEYDDRKDINKYYVSGSEIQQVDILDVIRIKYKDGTILHTYNLKYDEAGIYTHLEEIEVSDTEGKKLTPTKFEWGATTPDFDFEGTGIPNNEEEVDYTFGDFNGDGKTDVVCTYYDNGSVDHFTLYYSNGDGSFFGVADEQLNEWTTYYSYFLTGDFDGNGLEDLAMIGLSSFRIFKSITTENGHEFEISAGSTSFFYETQHYFRNVDLNGNGKDDLILIDYNVEHYAGGYITVVSAWEFDEYNFIMNNLINMDGDDYYHFHHTENDLLQIFPGDFNGDRKTDLLINKSANACDIMTYDPTTKHLIALNPQPLNYPTKNHNQIFPGDYNGDGITDLLTGYSYNQTAGWEVNYFNGIDGWVSGNCPVNIPEGDSWHVRYDNFKSMVSDYNGDGKTDILQFYEEYYDPGHGDTLRFEGSHYVAYYSNGLNYVKDSTFNTSHNAMLERPYPYNDFDGDGKNDCFIDDKTENSYNQILFLHKDEQTQLLQKITNGFGVSTEIDYLPLTDQTVYTKRTDAEYPMVDIQPAIQVVSISRIDNDYGDYFSMGYTYEGAIAHALGKGYLGFQQLQVNNHQTNTYTTSEYKLHDASNLHYHLYLENQETWWTSKSNVFLINKLVNDFDVIPNDFNEKIYTPVVTQSLAHSWDIDENNTFIKTVKSIQNKADIDNYGNSKKTTVLIDPAQLDENASNAQYDHKVVTDSEFEDNLNTSKWLISRPDEVTITRTYTGKTPDVLLTEYDYYEWNESGGNGIVSWPLVKSVTSKPNGNVQFKNKVQYEYNELGNLVKEIVSAPNANPAVEDRIIIYEYRTNSGYEGRFLTTTKRSIDYVPYWSRFEYDIVTGRPVSATDPAQLETTYTYDGFGKLTNTNFPDGTNQNTLYVNEGETLWWNSYAPLKAAYCTFTQLSGTAPVYRFYDKLQRELRQVTFGLEDDDMLYIDKTYYETDGRLKTVSDPYCSNATPQYFTSYRYDDIGRVILQDAPTNAISMQYSGRTLRTKNRTTELTVIKNMNAIGKILTVTDPTGTITYNYLSSGNIESIDALGAITTMQYNAAGYQTLLDEPNAGPTEYTYNAYGELIEQTDARNNTYELAYDKFGRLTTKTLINTAETTTYSYNNWEHPPMGNGFGKLGSVSGSNGISYQYDYDLFNRIESKTEVIEGTNYSEQYSYNVNGQLETLTYPSDFSVTYAYSSTGRIKTVTENENDEIIWEALATNCRGQLTDFVLGNGLSTHLGFDDYGYPDEILTGNIQELGYEFNPSTGNLTKRWSNYNNVILNEEFDYDNQLHSRLTGWQVTGGQQYLSTILNNGNINFKSDVTSFYKGDGNKEIEGEYIYGDGAGPHAVTDIQNPTANYLTSVNTLLDIDYTAFNKVKRITNTNIPPMHILTTDFVYGPDQRRKITYDQQRGHIIKTKYFIGANYEIEKDPQGNERKLHYLSAGNGVFAIYEMIDGGTNNMYYIHKDYLGSFESVTDDNGVLLERSSYDPWGRRRNATDWTFNSVGCSMFDRGYTGHQHMGAFELINMNGRVYDPWLGRFLSPDPFVQAPTYSQNYNRYSYALNNPLKYIDPSGYHYEEYTEGTNPTGGSSHYNYGSDDFGGYADFNNSWRMNFQQSISTNLTFVTFNLRLSPNGGTWSRKGGYTYFTSSAIDGDAYSYGYAYNTHHKSWEHTEITDKRVIYNLNHGLAWNAGRGNTGTGLSYSGNNNLVGQSEEPQSELINIYSKNTAAHLIVELMRTIETNRISGHISDYFTAKSIPYGADKRYKASGKYDGSYVEINTFNPENGPDYGHFHKVKYTPFSKVGRISGGTIDIAGQYSVISLRIYDKTTYYNIYEYVYGKY